MNHHSFVRYWFIMNMHLCERSYLINKDCYAIATAILEYPSNSWDTNDSVIYGSCIEFICSDPVLPSIFIRCSYLFSFNGTNTFGSKHSSIITKRECHSTVSKHCSLYQRIIIFYQQILLIEHVHKHIVSISLIYSSKIWSLGLDTNFWGGKWLINIFLFFQCLLRAFISKWIRNKMHYLMASTLSI